MQRQPSGAGGMAALLGVARQEVEALCAELREDGVLQPANYNDPGQMLCRKTARVHAATTPSPPSRQADLLKVSALPLPYAATCGGRLTRCR